MTHRRAGARPPPRGAAPAPPREPGRSPSPPASDAAGDGHAERPAAAALTPLVDVFLTLLHDVAADVTAG